MACIEKLLDAIEIRLRQSNMRSSDSIWTGSQGGVELDFKFRISQFANLEILSSLLHQEVQLFLHLLYQSSNSIFDFNLQILSSTSIFKFYLQLQSSNAIFDFNLRASFTRLSFQVNETCWKSPKLNRRILAFFEKINLFWAFFE